MRLRSVFAGICIRLCAHPSRDPRWTSNSLTDESAGREIRVARPLALESYSSVCESVHRSSLRKRAEKLRISWQITLSNQWSNFMSAALISKEVPDASFHPTQDSAAVTGVMGPIMTHSTFQIAPQNGDNKERTLLRSELSRIDSVIIPCRDSSLAK